MDNTKDLRALLVSRHPLLIVPSGDEGRVLSIVRRTARDLSLPIWLWSATRGLARDGHEAQYGTLNPVQALRFIHDLAAPGVFVFADVHPYLDDPLVVRTIKEAAQQSASGQTIVLTVATIGSPAELESIARLWRLRPPADAEIADLLDRTLRDLKSRGFGISIDAAARLRMIEALKGLSIGEAERLIQQAAAEDGDVTGADVGRMQRAKAELLTADRILELIEADHGTLEDVGGFERLKDWLAMRSRRNQEAAAGLGIESLRRYVADRDSRVRQVAGHQDLGPLVGSSLGVARPFPPLFQVHR